jgi:hypothetical protein
MDIHKPNAIRGRCRMSDIGAERTLGGSGSNGCF